MGSLSTERVAFSRAHSRIAMAGRQEGEVSETNVAQIKEQAQRHVGKLRRGTFFLTVKCSAKSFQPLALSTGQRVLSYHGRLGGSGSIDERRKRQSVVPEVHTHHG